MDDIGNFLYILIILLSVVFSAFKTSKKKQGKPTPTSTDPVPDPMEEFRRFFENRKEEPVMEEDFIPEVEEMEIEPVEPLEKDYRAPKPEQVEAVPQTVTKHKFYSHKGMDRQPIQTDDNEESVFDTEIGDEISKGAIRGADEVQEDVLEAFTLKEAVIYDAILNRPY